MCHKTWHDLLLLIYIWDSLYAPNGIGLYKSQRYDQSRADNGQFHFGANTVGVPFFVVVKFATSMLMLTFDL